MNRVSKVAMVWLAAATPAFAAAKGTFVNDGLRYPVVDAVAYERPADHGGGIEIRLALSMRPIDPKAIADALDIEEAVKAQRGESPYVDFDFAPDGSWRGASYLLGQGNGCGWCSDPKAAAKSQVRVEGGALRGTMKVLRTDYNDGDGPAIDLTLDVPIVRVTATALPANGGEPGKVFLACRQQAKAKDADGARASCFARDDARVGKHWEAEPEAFWSIATMYLRDSLVLPALRITGGRTRGDWAELVVEGKDEHGQTKKGSVFLRRGAGGWRYHHEKVQSAF